MRFCILNLAFSYIKLLADISTWNTEEESSIDCDSLVSSRLSVIRLWRGRGRRSDRPRAILRVPRLSRGLTR